jgi:hypothetical protein
VDEPHLQAQIAAAAAYEDFCIPSLFQQWPPLVINAAGIQPGNVYLM